MTATTRRRLVVCLVAVVLTLPIETILLRAVSSTTAQDAQAWASGLSSDQALYEGSRIQRLPFEYRRELMGKLPASARAGIWRAHIQSYVAQRPELNGVAKSLLESAAALASTAAFDNPSAELRAQLVTVAEQAAVVLGRDEAEYLFYRLGPRDLTIATALPIVQRLTHFVRSTLVVQARADGCDCHTGFGCDAPNHCDSGWECEIDEEWPMCGWWWEEVCDGVCLGGIE